MLKAMTQYSALELAAAIRAKQVSPVEVMEATLSQIDAVNDKVNAVIWRNDDEAQAAARAAADAIMQTEPADLPRFHGVPIPIKDTTAVAGWPLTYGSWAVPDTPSEESELIVEAFQRAGFVLTGRTNTPEFGMLGVAENDRYGITRNPWNLDRTPGGSSGGAAAAVAAGMFAVAHGSDGGGSIRVPASCCGLVGLKVSRGRVPARVMSWGSAVDGIVSRDVADAAAILDVISYPDRGAWYYAPAATRPFLSEVGTAPGRLRIGLVVEATLGSVPTDHECVEAAREAAVVLEEIGHHVEPTSFRVSEEFYAASLNVMYSGLAGIDADWTRAEPHIRALWADVQAVDGLAYMRSLQDLQRLSRELVSGWGSKFDLLLTPTMSVVPPRAGDISAAVHEAAQTGVAADESYWTTAFTPVFNMTGQPAISVPTHMTADGVPIGVHLVAGLWEEALLLRVASQLEAALPWAHRRPPSM